MSAFNPGQQSILPTLSSGQWHDVLREVHSRYVHGSMDESPHVGTVQICACSKASIDHLSHGLTIHLVCIRNRSTFKGQDPS